MCKAVLASLAEVVQAEALREIPVVDRDGRTQLITLQAAMVRSLGVRAVKGSTPAARALLREIGKATAARGSGGRGTPSLVAAGLEMKAAAGLLEDLLGASFPGWLPRADEVEIDFCADDVTLRRPMGREEQADWDGAALIRRAVAEERAQVRAHLADSRYAGLTLALRALDETLARLGRTMDEFFATKWHLTPAELAEPLRHVRPRQTLDALRPQMSALVRGLIDKADLALLALKIQRCSYAVAAEDPTAPSIAEIEAMKERLRRHPERGEVRNGGALAAGEGAGWKRRGRDVEAEV